MTKEELLNAIWSGTFVGEAVLKVADPSYSRILGDDPRLHALSRPHIVEAIALSVRFRASGRILQKEREIRSNSAVGSLATVADAFQGLLVATNPFRRCEDGWTKCLKGSGRSYLSPERLASARRPRRYVRTKHCARSEYPRRPGAVSGAVWDQRGLLPVLEAVGRLCRDTKKSSRRCDLMDRCGCCKCLHCFPPRS